MNFIPHAERPTVRRRPRDRAVIDTQTRLRPEFEVLPPIRPSLLTSQTFFCVVAVMVAGACGYLLGAMTSLMIGGR